MNDSVASRQSYDCQKCQWITAPMAQFCFFLITKILPMLSRYESLYQISRWHSAGFALHQPIYTRRQVLILIYWLVMHCILTLDAHQVRILINFRLLHSPSLVAIGLSVGYEAWHPIGWHHAFAIGWSKYRLRLPSAPLHYGLPWPMGIPPFFQTSVTVPLHSTNGRQYLPLGLCKGIVKESR